MSRRDKGNTRLPTLTGFSKSGTIRRELHPVLLVAVFVKEFVAIWGVILHEFAHVLACVRYDLELSRVVYFNPKRDTISGYIDFQTPRNYWESFVVFTAPFYVGSLVAVFLFLWLGSNGVTPWTVESASLGEWVVVWVAMSVSVKSIPSPEDVQYVGTYDEGDPELHELQEVLVTPLLAVFRRLSVMPVYFLDVAYALGCWVVVSGVV